jgi:CMP-N,N'-diacetyllegionaminic acid synthase
MYKGKKILALIPARGGSKGIPHKNITQLGEKPLLAWTVEAAKASKYVDRLILSSDDEQIISVAKSIGCDVPFIRPSDLSQDDTPGMAPVFHALEQIKGYDYILQLQPTSPLRTEIDIDSAIELCLDGNAHSCVSVTEPDKSPYWMYTLNENLKMSPLLDGQYIRRQELPAVYALNGAIYIAQVDWIFKNKSFLSRETLAYIMPKERSVDIDTMIDITIAEALLKYTKKC